MKTLQAVKDELKKVPLSNEVHYFCSVVYFLEIDRTNVVYKSCLTEGCRQKVTEDDSGRLSCKDCGAVDDFRYKFMVSGTISDNTDTLKVSFFEDVAMDVFDKSASELMDVRDQSEEMFNNEIDSVCVGKWEVVFRYKLRSVGGKRCGFVVVTRAKKTFRDASSNRVAIRKEIDRLNSLLH